ncbi:mucin-2-like [Penaeus chinensis]|uniref:mucin-2-like n=1 Tax=Penaeus chinensis TaxID=139456 RepID=UPI001FB7EF80|nr:mucin-2-like [Penaeus chinensis]
MQSSQESPAPPIDQHSTVPYINSTCSYSNHHQPQLHPLPAPADAVTPYLPHAPPTEPPSPTTTKHHNSQQPPLYKQPPATLPTPLQETTTPAAAPRTTPPTTIIIPSHQCTTSTTATSTSNPNHTPSHQPPPLHDPEHHPASSTVQGLTHEHTEDHPNITRRTFTDFHHIYRPELSALQNQKFMVPFSADVCEEQACSTHHIRLNQHAPTPTQRTNTSTYRLQQQHKIFNKQNHSSKTSEHQNQPQNHHHRILLKQAPSPTLTSHLAPRNPHTCTTTTQPQTSQDRAPPITQTDSAPPEAVHRNPCISKVDLAPRYFSVDTLEAQDTCTTDMHSTQGPRRRDARYPTP